MDALISSVEADAVLACKLPIKEPVISTSPCTLSAAETLVLVVPMPTNPLLLIIIAGMLSLFPLFIESLVKTDRPFLAQICKTSSVLEIEVFLRTTTALDGTVLFLSFCVEETVVSI